MGTRSMTYVIDDCDGKTPLISLYRQFDGYPKGMGQDIYNFLANRKVVNGFGKASKLLSNGMDDLAAQLTTFLKTSNETGNVYLFPLRKLPAKKATFVDYRNKYLIKYAKDCGCEYVYIIRYINNTLEVQVWGIWDKELLFSGAPQEMASVLDLKLDEALTE